MANIWLLGFRGFLRTPKNPTGYGPGIICPLFFSFCQVSELLLLVVVGRSYNQWKSISFRQRSSKYSKSAVEKWHSVSFYIDFSKLLLVHASFSGKVVGHCPPPRVPAPLLLMLLRNCSISISVRYFQDLKRSSSNIQLKCYNSNAATFIALATFATGVDNYSHHCFVIVSIILFIRSSYMKWIVALTVDIKH